jgi:hypothetical protein
MDVYPEQAVLLEEIAKGQCFNAEDLPKAPDELRKPPPRPKLDALFEESED